MEEAVNIKLTAQDVASAVLSNVADNVDVVSNKLKSIRPVADSVAKSFKQMTTEVIGFANGKPVTIEYEKTFQRIEKNVDDVGITAKKSAKAIGDFASIFGAGEIGNAATTFANIKDSVMDANVALKSGGASAVAMKLGLVGITAIASYKIGEVIAGWAYETSRFAKELEEATSRAKELGDIQSGQSGRRIDQEIADLKEFGGTFEQQMKAAKEIASQIANDISGKKAQEEQAKADLKRLESQRKFYIASQEEVDNAKANLEIIQQQKKVFEEKLVAVQLEFSEGELNRKKRREGIAQEKIQDQERIKFILDAEERKKKIAEERAKYDERQIEKESKLREQALKKQQAMAIKAAGESVRAIEKQISELDKTGSGVSDSSTLQGRDERLTSLSRTNPLQVQQQQLEFAKKQAELDKLNNKLLQEMAKFARLQAEKEENVVEFSGVG